MAVVDFINTFRIQADQPIDSRFVLADEAERLAYPKGALYEGLIVYQLDTKVLWTLVDKNASEDASGWSRETSDDIVSITASEVKSNGFRDLIFTFESGKVITIENAFKEAEKGDKGDTGADGARGEQGAMGLPGSQGQMGLPGTDGINGQDGTNGTDGTDGQDGAQGARGQQGLPGTPGTDGTDGTDGQQGIPGTNGTDGSDGQPGKDGAMGNTGPAGSDASVTKENVDLALEIGDSDNDFYYNNEGEWVKLLDPTKGQIDDAIGANPGTNDPRRFYAEDGQFRVPAGGGGGTPGVVEYDDVLDIPIQRNRLVNIFTVTGTRGNVVPAGANAEFATITIRNDYIPGVDGSFTFIPDVTFQAYGFNALFSQVFTGSNLTEYITQIGNEAAGLSELITWDGVITTALLNGEPASSITLDMGVTTPINSAFSVTGTNPEATVTNQSTGGTPPTSITIMLGEVEVFSFNASALGVNDNNINFVGTTAATGINNITQFPVNWQAEYQNNTNQQEIVITSDVAGPQPVWSFIVNNNGVTGNNAGNIGFTGPTFDTVQANLIDIITFPDGTFQTTAATGGGGGGDLFVNITRGGTFLMADGTKLPSGADATDTRGNDTARYNTIEYGNDTYYWIQEVGLPKASIIRTGNITNGAIVASKTY